MWRKQDRNAHRGLVRKHKRNILLSRPKCSWEGNVKTDLNGVCTLASPHSQQESVAKGYEYRSEHAGSLKWGKVLISSATVSFICLKRTEEGYWTLQTSNFGGQILNRKVPNKCQKCYFLHNSAVCTLLFYQVICCKSVARLEKGRSIKREGVSSMKIPEYWQPVRGWVSGTKTGQRRCYSITTPTIRVWRIVYCMKYRGSFIIGYITAPRYSKVAVIFPLSINVGCREII